MQTQTYHKRIKLKYKILSFFYDLVEVFFSNTETNPRHGLARQIPNDDLLISDRRPRGLRVPLSPCGANRIRLRLLQGLCHRPRHGRRAETS